MSPFESITIGNVFCKNRIFRSATYEGRCDSNGFPKESYFDYYENLAKGGAGAIITGFAFISKEGRAMQPGQAGIDNPDKIPYFKRLSRSLNSYQCPVFMQIAHTGRQTTKAAAGGEVRGCSSKRSIYFRVKPVPFTTKEVYEKIDEFASAAEFTRDAGFNGVQIHAAHGYLIHQFLVAAINDRQDEFGIDKETGIGSRFLEMIVNSVRKRCGDDYPILVKVSGGHDLNPHFTLQNFRSLIMTLDRLHVDAIEISYGTMDYPVNIIRGDIPVNLVIDQNPFFKSSTIYGRVLSKVILKSFYYPRIIRYSPVYNLKYAEEAKKITKIPIISVGGFRNYEQISEAIEKERTDVVSLSRPFICEPDFVNKVKIDLSHESTCNNCNKCLVMCDSGKPTLCYNHKNLKQWKPSMP